MAHAAIPFVPAWVWVYELTYLLPFLAVFAIEDAARFDRALRAILFAAVTAYPLYLCLPVGFPQPALGDSLAERALALERSLDAASGANHLPRPRSLGRADHDLAPAVARPARGTHQRRFQARFARRASS